MAIDRETGERIARLEVRLDHVQDGLQELKVETRDRLEEIKELVMRIPPSDPPPPPVAPPTVLEWVSKNWKPILVVLGLLTGTSLVEALKLLGP